MGGLLATVLVLTGSVLFSAPRAGAATRDRPATRQVPATRGHYHHVTMPRSDRRRALRATGIAITLAGMGSNLAACSANTPQTANTTTGSSGTGTAVVAPSRLSWIVTRRALAYIATNPVALSVLEQGTIYEIVAPGSLPYHGVNAIVTADFKSYTGPSGIAAAVSSGSLPVGTKAILYDNEQWSQTPVVEQRNLGKYVAMAITLAHSHGYKLIATPGVDLMNVLDPSKKATMGRYQAFVSDGIAKIVGGADVVDIQAQSDERVASQYATFVKAAAAQVHAVNPKAEVIAGLSSNPPIGAVTSQQLAAAIAATSTAVNGYWINIPKPSLSCPSCGAPQPEVAIGALTIAFPGS
jgi:hypothetical protein